MNASGRLFIAALFSSILLSCGSFNADLFGTMDKCAPVLSELIVKGADKSSITLQPPSFKSEGNPAAVLTGYYAVSGVMGDNAPDVSLGEQWEINESGDNTISGLAVNTEYQIVVVAENEIGRSVKTTNVTTYGAAPKIKEVSISSTTSSITVSWPSFSIAGTPAPKVTAYVAGKSNSVAMSIVDSGDPAAVTVSGADYSAVIPVSDPSLGDSTDSVTFDGLDPDTAYCVIVVAANSIGYSSSPAAEVVTGVVAPTVSDFTFGGITTSAVIVSSIDMGTIGAGTVTVTGYVTEGTSPAANGWLSSPLKTVTPFAAGTQIDGLAANTAYILYVVAKNSAGTAWKGKPFTTAMIAPVISPYLSLCSTGSTVTVGMPIFTTAPNPAATSVKAYIYKTSDTATFSLEGVPSVSGAEAQSISLLSGGSICGGTLNGLDGNTQYSVRVVAVNPEGSSYADGTVSTAMIAPVLGIPEISVSGGTVSVKPNLVFAGNPEVTSVSVYIGEALSVVGNTVSGAVASDISPGLTSSKGTYAADVSVSAVVVAQNGGGYSVKTAEVRIPNGTNPSFVWLSLDGVYGSVSASSITVNAPFLTTLQPVVTYGVPSGVTVQNGGSAFASGSTLDFSGPVTLTATYMSSSYYPVTLTSYGRVSTPILTGIVSPYGITTDGANLYVLDRNEIHRFPAGAAPGTVIAGGSQGYADGDGTSAQFYGANGIVYSEGYLYVADTRNSRIRRVMTSAPYTVTTLAGSGSEKLEDGIGTNASFYLPYSLIEGGQGILYIADTNNNVIRKVKTSTGAVTTLAGNGFAGNTDGSFSAATFNNPSSLALVGGILYVGDGGNRRIRALDLATKTVSTFAGSSAGSDDGIGTYAKFSKIRGLTTDGINLFVTDTDPDTNSARIRKIMTSNAKVTTVAGSASSGTVDGVGPAASFYDLFGIVYLNSALYVSDPTNHMIRKIE
jgi:hypothetical protein